MQVRSVLLLPVLLRHSVQLLWITTVTHSEANSVQSLRTEFVGIVPRATSASEKPWLTSKRNWTSLAELSTITSLLQLSVLFSWSRSIPVLLRSPQRRVVYRFRPIEWFGKITT